MIDLPPFTNIQKSVVKYTFNKGCLGWTKYHFENERKGSVLLSFNATDISVGRPVLQQTQRLKNIQATIFQP